MLGIQLLPEQGIVHRKPPQMNYADHIICDKAIKWKLIYTHYDIESLRKVVSQGLSASAFNEPRRIK